MSANSEASILLVDDVRANLLVLREMLEPEGYVILAAPSGEICLKIAQQANPALILLDVVMPDMNGFEACARLKAEATTEEIPVIFITGKDRTEDIIQGFEVGGVDYITKPFDRRELLARVHTHLAISQLTRELVDKNAALVSANERLRDEVARRERAEDARQAADEQLALVREQEAFKWGIEGFVGKSPTIMRILEYVQRLQNVSTTSVLITGETGTGKELIARAIHSGGARRKQRFVPVNCSAIPRELAESTLFGHVRGAFTGAGASRKGCFELADGGTLFLDEIGDMPIALQTKLLRVLEDQCIEPVGSSEQKCVDVRVLAATNSDLPSKIAAGAFREDLYYRLARFTVTVPPLRERVEDIPLLTAHFLRTLSANMGIEHPRMDPQALEMLAGYQFPGNVRELRNLVERALILSSDGQIKPEHLYCVNTVSHSGTRISPIGTEPSFTYPGTELQRDLQELVVKRAQPRREQASQAPQAQALSLSEPAILPDGTDEERILGYVHQYGSINNAECRELLDVSRNRAKHLLNKLTQYSLLMARGERRWMRYHLP